MTEEIPGKEIKEFIINNIKVKENIIRTWKISFKPRIREVVVLNRDFISTKWTDSNHCVGFIVECLHCKEDFSVAGYEQDLFRFIMEHSEEHIRKRYKIKNKTLDEFI